MPVARNRTSQPISAGQWAYLEWTNDGWEIEPLVSAAFCAVPPCGQGIPARVGDVPGQNECCLFAIEGGVLVPIVDDESQAVRVTVYNVRDVAVPAAAPPGDNYVLVHHRPDGPLGLRIASRRFVNVFVGYDNDHGGPGGRLYRIVQVGLEHRRERLVALPGRMCHNHDVDHNLHNHHDHRALPVPGRRP